MNCPKCDGNMVYQGSTEGVKSWGDGSAIDIWYCPECDEARYIETTPKETKSSPDDDK